MAPRSFKDNCIVLIKANAFSFPSAGYALQIPVHVIVFDNNDWLRGADLPPLTVPLLI